MNALPVLASFPNSYPKEKKVICFKERAAPEKLQGAVQRKIPTANECGRDQYNMLYSAKITSS